MPASNKSLTKRTGTKVRKRKAAVVDDADQAHRQAVAAAIATELAPEVAIALLAKTERDPGSDEAALAPIAAGVSAADDDDKVRLRLVFENGAVLPVELPKEAGDALARGLDELDLEPKQS